MLALLHSSITAVKGQGLGDRAQNTKSELHKEVGDFMLVQDWFHGLDIVVLRQQIQAN